MGKDTHLAQHLLRTAVRAHLFLSIRMTSPWSEGGPLICCPLWSRYCHSSMSSMASFIYFTSLLSRCGTPNVRLCGPGRCLQGFKQGANSVIDVALTPGMFVRDTSGSFPVDRHVLLYFRGFALDFECALQRLLCIHAEFVMSCTAVANLPEGVTKLNARGFMCSPAISEVLGCRG